VPCRAVPCRAVPEIIRRLPLIRQPSRFTVISIFVEISSKFIAIASIADQKRKVNRYFLRKCAKNLRLALRRSRFK
jgi:hypothetical protein